MKREVREEEGKRGREKGEDDWMKRKEEGKEREGKERRERGGRDSRD